MKKVEKAVDKNTEGNYRVNAISKRLPNHDIKIHTMPLNDHSDLLYTVSIELKKTRTTKAK